ncbi:hypothetical protein [Thalassobius sp. Cn5-15]|uniref:hypothetical protein n=1 Tax=Thalassobius sp. Cn5-15 TaxID=2917763 RepID=UPI001EF3940B|nr:hypothetical protein [Thalassobius sp. Cn5-15]MCG7492428.1 hypothetical protein [Thalassobius sp. Cn5-15]
MTQPKNKKRAHQNVSARFRAQDEAIEIFTDAYVSHRRANRGGYASSFSLNVDDAKALRDLINIALEDHNDA